MFPHLKFIRYTTTMLSRKGVKKYVCSALFALGCFAVPAASVFAQSYVPVDVVKFDAFDIQIGSAIPDGGTDSLRDLISGSNPNVNAMGGPCISGPNLGPGILADEELGGGGQTREAAFAYETGPWQDASKETGMPTGVPDGATENGPYVDVNISQSLRCLLRDIGEFQRLNVTVQIHSLLKTYIADAQTKQLNNQLLNYIAATNIDWAKAGNEVNDNGVLSNSPVYNINPSQDKYNKNTRQLEHIADQAAADPDSGNPVGSLGICEPWRLDTTANMVRNNRPGVEDPINYTQEATGCKLDGVIAPVDYSKFSDNFNDPASILGGPATLDSVLLDPANSPLGSATLANQVASGRIARQTQATEEDKGSTGFLPTSKCSGDPGDPYCLDQQFSTDINPGDQNSQVVRDMASQGDQQIRDANTLDAHGAEETKGQSMEINTQTGVYGYDTHGIHMAHTVVNQLVREFYDTIEWGYFGVHESTQDWAQGAMLMIYDEMEFDDETTNTITTRDQEAFDTKY